MMGTSGTRGPEIAWGAAAPAGVISVPVESTG